ncbi:hypothetical protein B0O80DRAFT_428908 [Mortierella sp. GBAus27b]|nr:hypothetical protein B0O80DRAFT_428908 [Mortierella sp. GBAus27b]
MQHFRRMRVAATLVTIVVLDLIIAANSAPLIPPRHENVALAINANAGSFLHKRAPLPPIVAPAPGGSTTVVVVGTTEVPPHTSNVPSGPATSDPITTPPITIPPITTPPITTPPITTPPVTTPPVTTPPITTQPPTTRPPTSSDEETTSERKTSKPTDRPTGKSSHPGGSTTTTQQSATSPPGPTPTSDEQSSSPSVVPIVVGVIVGVGALVGAGLFFFFRFRKSRRFDSKRPLSFLALSLDDPSGRSESPSTRAAGTDAIYDPSRPITPQPPLSYNPPVMSGLLGSTSRFSYQSPSEHSGSVGGPYIAQWGQDEENTALVGEHELHSEKPFVASSMMHIGPNDPLHFRYSHQQEEGSPGMLQENPPLRAVNADAPTSPLNVHANPVQGSSARSPEATSDESHPNPK